MKKLIFSLLFLCLVSATANAASISGGGGGGSGTIPPVTAFPGSPSVGQTVRVTDDSAVGACDSAAGTAVSLCYWTGAVWAAVGDGSGAGAGDISDVWACTTANCNALTAAAGDSLDAGLADSSRPATRLTTLPGTCSEGQLHQDTDSGGTETYICTDTNTWTKIIASTDNVATATALAANGGNCSAGSAPLGVDASGAAETCTNYTEEPASSGLVARTAANTTAARAVTGTTNEIAVTNGDGVSGNPTVGLAATVDLGAKVLEIPHSTSLPGTCNQGEFYGADSATSGQRLYYCQSANTWVVQGDGGAGGGGTILGTVGTTDNMVPRADGTGGVTLQASGCSIDDTNLMTCPGGFAASTSGVGVVTLLEGTAPGGGANAGEHTIYFNSTNSLLQSHEFGGSAVTYYSTANVPTALAADGSNCSAGQFPLGVDASGVAQNCTALPTTISGTANEIAASASTGAITLSLPSTVNLSSKTVRVPNSATLPGTCTVGDSYMDTDATSGLRFYLCEATNTWTAQGTGGGTGITSLAAQTGNTQTITRGTGIGGSSGTDDHAFTFASTELAGLTWGDGSQASHVWDFNLSAGDPQLTFGNGVFNLTSGALQVGGVAVPTISSTSTLTNKTLDAEAPGNVLTTPRRIWFPAAGCNNATAGSVWDLPTSNPAVAACVTGTNTQKGVLDFADASNLSAQITYKLPSTWTGTVELNIKWFTSATTGDVIWQTQTSCVADGETDDPSWNTADEFAADTAKGTANQTNDVSDTSVTMTGCAAGELLHLKLLRDSAHINDTLGATARLIGAELVIREAI